MCDLEPSRPLCPECGKQAEPQQTQYGIRDACKPCGLWSWHGRPLVSGAIHRARQECHAIFDPLWMNATAAYDIEESQGTTERRKVEKKIRRTARNRAYRYIAFKTGLPEPECHMSEQQDIAKLRLIYRAAKDCSGPHEIREWWKSGGEVWWRNQKKEATNDS